MELTAKSLVLSLVTALSFVTLGCSKKSDTPKSEVARFLWNEQTEANAKVKVLNEFGEPLESAQVLIGYAQGTPFKGNFLTTDKNGVARIPTDWNAKAHVTVEAAGYIRQTLLSQNPGDISLKLLRRSAPARPEINGKVTGLPVVNGDKMTDFALVIPAMTRGDLLNFDLNAVISPYSDTISVVGQEAKIPGNVSLPSQKESYLFPITIAKPVYRLTSTTLGAKRFFAIRGQFPFKKTIDEMRAGKPFYDMINNFSIQGGGMRDITLTQPVTTLDIPGNELIFSSKVRTQSAAIATDEVQMVVAVSDVAGTLAPTDIKKFTGESHLQLATLPNKKTYIVNILKRQTEVDPAATAAAKSNRISAALSIHNEAIKPLFLPLVESPTVTETSGLVIGLPSKPNQAGINALAVSASISDLVPFVSGTETVINVNRRWEIIGLGWDQSMELPNWPLGDSAAERRIEINFIGSTTHKGAKLDDNLIEAATHVTHASTDF